MQWLLTYLFTVKIQYIKYEENTWSVDSNFTKKVSDSDLALTEAANTFDNARTAFEEKKDGKDLIDGSSEYTQAVTSLAESKQKLDSRNEELVTLNNEYSELLEKQEKAKIKYNAAQKENTDYPSDKTDKQLELAKTNYHKLNDDVAVKKLQVTEKN